ncbi:MAG: leucine-rich repeat protein [Coriobacteriales bacterium]
MLAAFLLVAALVPIGMGVAFAEPDGAGSESTEIIENPATSNDDSTAEPSAEGDQSVDGEMGDSSGDSQPDGAAGQQAADGEAAEQDAESETPAAGEASFELFEDIASGTLANDWQWKLVSGEEDGETVYKLTFEYTGTADPVPALAIPENFIEGIANDLGENKDKITKIEVPEGATTIGTNAFKDMPALEDVELPKTLTAIGDEAFRGCDKLETVNLEDTKIKDASKSMFQNCSSLKGVKFPSTLTRILADAFNGCSSLKTADFSDVTGLTVVRANAFRDSGLESIDIPDSITSIQESVFEGCKSLKTASMPALSYLNSNLSDEKRLFANCSALEELTFHPVSRSVYSRANLPDQVLIGDNSLKKLDLSGYSNYSYGFKLQDNSTSLKLFGNNDLSKLEEIVLPTSTNVTIGNGVFSGKTGLKSLDVFTNPQSVTSIGTSAFENSGLTKADLSDWTNSSLTTIPENAFANCKNLSEVVIPANITTLGKQAFANDPELKSVAVNSKTLTSVDKTVFDGTVNDMTITIGKDVEQLTANFFVVAPESAKIKFEGESIIKIDPATYSGGLRPLKDLGGTYWVTEEGVLYKLDDDGTASLAYVPDDLESYTVPETLTTTTDAGVPGATYTVDRMKAHAVHHAPSLTSLTFEAPQNVIIEPSAFSGRSTSSDAKGLTVNGKTEIDPDDFALVSIICDYPLKSDVTGSNLVPTITSTAENPDGSLAVKTMIVVSEKAPGEDDIYHYKTGEEAIYTIAIRNGDNVMDDVVRVYISYDNSGQNMGSFPPGEYTIVNSTPPYNKYPVKVVETGAKGVYYYEITGIQPGETLAFNCHTLYPHPNTSGGTMHIWTTTLTAEEAAAQEGRLINPTDYMQLEWTTTPITYDLEKNRSYVWGYPNGTSSSGVNQNASIKVNNSGEATVANLAFTINEKNHEGSSAVSQGGDYIRWVQYEDIVDLPDELSWRPDVIEAIKKGAGSSGGSDGWWIEDGSTYCDYSWSRTTGTVSTKVVKVRAGGKVYDLAHIYDKNSSRSNILGITPEIVEVDGQQKLKLTWRMNNPVLNSYGSADNEYPIQQFYLRFGDNVILADVDAVNDLFDENPGATESPLKVHNDATEKRHYSYSPVQTAEDDASDPVDANAGMDVTKFWSSNSSGYVKGGTYDPATIRISNTGIMGIDQWGSLVQATGEDGKPMTDEQGKPVYEKDSKGRDKTNGRIVEDTLPTMHFIEPGNIEAMLNATTTAGSGAGAQTVPIGDWLTITISSATLCTPGQYQPVDGTDQNNKYTVGNNSNIQAGSDEGARVKEKASFTITKTDEGSITVTLAGDTIAENNKTYTIGDGGDYATIEDLFDAVGFFPTRNTAYKLTYDAPEGFMLKAGQILNFDLKSTMKTTPMMLTSDARNYNSGSYGSSARNTATVKANVGGTLVTRNPYTDYRYWSHELYFYKNGFVEGSNTTLSGSEIKVDQGTVLDFYLNGYTSGNTRLYEHQLMSDYMDGAMVALAPVAQNPDLTAPDGSALETYTSGGTTYWLLNKPGTYENVKIGSTSRNGAASYETRTLTVSETVSGGKRTSLATFIQWQPWENWGTGGNTAARVYYKVLVSAEEAGLITEGGDESDSFSINNKAWLGDHQGHRLWDWLIGEYQVYSMGKHIVDPENGKGDGTDTTATGGGLIDYSRVHVGETVTYQMEVNNLTPVPTKLTGKSLRDALPDTYGVFAWTRGDDSTPANVENLRYIATDGVTITAGTGDDKVNLDTHGGTNPNDTYWTIVPSTKSRQHRDGSTITTLSRNGGYDINWSDDFAINFNGHGSVKILVDLKFPERPVDGASTWDQYVAKVRGEELYNTFYVNGLWDEVSHTLEATGKPVLYKGVYDTGLTTHGTGTSTYSASYTSNKSRYWYANGTTPSSYSDEDLKAETVTYYTVLYNGSFDRMYLSDLQDQLPRGFTFNTMSNYCYGVTDLTASSWSQYGYVGYASPSSTRSTTNTEYPSESYKVATVVDNGTAGLDPADKPRLRYVNALVTASTATGDDGRQHITFKVGSPTSTNGSYRNIHYDPAVKKYYLNPGEALRFGYNVLVPEYAKTDDLATNTVAMPYYDYYGTDFALHVPNENGEGGALPKVRVNTGAKANDGGCQTMSGEQVESKYGMDASAYQDELYNNHEGGNWLVSSATVKRAPIIPGVQKAIGGKTPRVDNPTATTIQGSKGSTPSALYGSAYVGGAVASDIINWRLRVFSEAGSDDGDVAGTMMGYTVVDTVDGPYRFTGQVFYNMYRAGSKQTRNSQYLFTLGSRADGDTQVRISSGGGLSASGWRMLNIGSAEDDSDDDWFQFGTGTRSGKVKIEQDADGREIMTIRLDGTAYSIAGGLWADFCVHTQFASEDMPISEGKYNDVVLWPDQDYDPADVAQGRARTEEQYKDDGTIEIVNNGIQSGASVMLSMGFTTASWKSIAELNANGSPTGAKARSDDSPNYVTLDEKHNPFRYDLYMIGPTRVTARIVFIDDLPQEGDHSAFVEADKRNSEFTVGFWADNPDFAVTIAPKQGGAEKKLNPGQYQLQVTDRTEFTDDDWNGEGEGWTDITEATDDERRTALQSARSFRIVIADENAWQDKDKSKWLMGPECQMHISFNAVVDDPAAKPGQYAWNSFGYRYMVPLVFNDSPTPDNGLALEAQPLNVGVRIPSAPSLEKKLTELAQAMETKVIEVERQSVDEETGEPLFDENGDPIMETVEEEVTEPATTPVLDEDGNPVTDADGNPVTEPVMEHAAHKAAMDLDFGFIVYEGNPIAELDNALEMTNADIAAALGDRKYIYVPLKVEEGKSSAKANLWEWEFTAAYDEETDSFKTVEVTDDSGAKKPNWYWKDGTRYTVVELPVGDYDYDLLTLQTAGVPQEKNNVAFDNTSSRIIPLIGTNEWGPEYTSVTGAKVWKDAGNQDGVRPSEVVVRLLADGEEVDSRTVTAGTGWKWEFTNLLANNEDGTPIVYQTTEDAVDDYSATVETVKDNPYDFKVTNKHTPGKTSVSVSKVWDDGDNSDGFRPRSVTIHLLANGKDTGKKLKLTSANNWMGTFTGLDMRKDGKDLRYTVTEDEVDSYTTVISGDAKKGYVVTNMHMTSGSSGMDGDSPCPDCDNGKNGKKSKLAKAGDEAPIGLMLLLVGAGAVALAASRKTGRSRRES